MRCPWMPKRLGSMIHLAQVKGTKGISPSTKLSSCSMKMKKTNWKFCSAKINRDLWLLRGQNCGWVLSCGNALRATKKLNFRHQPAPQDCSQPPWFAALLAQWHFSTPRRAQYYCYEECGRKDQPLYLCPWISSTWGKGYLLLNNVLKHNSEAEAAEKKSWSGGETYFLNITHWNCGAM